MPTVAYIANRFPSPLEPYVAEEIQELRRRGTKVIPCSVWSADADLDATMQRLESQTLHLFPLQIGLLIRASWLCLTGWPLLSDVFARVVFRGEETLPQRVRALAHTWLGVYYALRLRGRGVEHIHAHHGYFASWIAMVAARMLGVSFSLTLHGSDVLVRPTYLDCKLENCRFCVTISEFNRRHIREHYPQVEADKIILRRTGVASARTAFDLYSTHHRSEPFVMLTVGRLHPVKGHDFLLQACGRLKDRHIRFLCLIAGEGPERPALERLIRELDLRHEVTLLGHLNRHDLDACYAACDLMVLTSRSEGIPLVLMEAMAHGRPVLAPAITGIPELVVQGKTGFLYRSGSIEDFVSQVETIRDLQPVLGQLRRSARQHVIEHFDRETNLAAFGDLFLARVAGTEDYALDEDPVLQQI